MFLQAYIVNVGYELGDTSGGDNTVTRGFWRWLNQHVEKAANAAKHVLGS